jgi:DNA invertase Pin-like site-specific DNA recombinase
MLERQRAGIARAKAEGKFKGRKPTTRAKSDAIMQLHGQGVAVGRDRPLLFAPIASRDTNAGKSCRGVRKSSQNVAALG